MKQSIFSRQSLLLVVLGAVGISQLWFSDSGLAELAELAGVSVETLKLAQMVQLLVLVLVATFTGSITSRRTGFALRTTTRLAEANRDWIVAAILAGGLVAGYNLLVSSVFPLIDDVSYQGRLSLAVLYGGLTEEILLRWGVMGFIAYLLIRIFRRANGKTGDLLVWANIAAAMLFAVGHFPALINMGSVEPIHFYLVFAANTLVGVLYGWVFAKHGLVFAMAAHGATHLIAAAALSLF